MDAYVGKRVPVAEVSPILIQNLLARTTERDKNRLVIVEVLDSRTLRSALSYLGVPGTELSAQVVFRRDVTLDRDLARCYARRCM